jgi:hypothetical protein
LSDTYYNYLKTTVMLGRINYLSNLLEWTFRGARTVGILNLSESATQSGALTT